MAPNYLQLLASVNFSSNRLLHKINFSSSSMLRTWHMLTLAGVHTLRMPHPRVPSGQCLCGNPTCLTAQCLNATPCHHSCVTAQLHLVSCMPHWAHHPQAMQVRSNTLPPAPRLPASHVNSASLQSQMTPDSHSDHPRPHTSLSHFASVGQPQGQGPGRAPTTRECWGAKWWRLLVFTRHSPPAAGQCAHRRSSAHFRQWRWQ